MIMANLSAKPMSKQPEAAAVVVAVATAIVVAVATAVVAAAAAKTGSEIQPLTGIASGILSLQAKVRTDTGSSVAR